MSNASVSSGGLVCTPRMSALIAQAGDGVLPSFNGGNELRSLFIDHSTTFDANLLGEFASSCYWGDLQAVRKAVESGQAPNLAETETPYNFGYATLSVLGSQTLSPRPKGTPRPHYAETLKYLLANRCPPDAPDICRYTALSHATLCPERNTELARILIERGANVNHPDIFGMTPICGAIMCAHSGAVDVLMEGGADLDIPDADGWISRKTYLFSGPKVAAAIHRWERQRVDKHVPLGEKGCGVCGKTGSLKYCAACHTARYCSPECQRSDWKKHKLSCKPFSASNTVTLKPRYHAGIPGVNLIPTQDRTRQLLGYSTSGRKRIFHEATKYPQKMIIKVQVGMLISMPLLVYDSKKEVVCQLPREDAPAAFDHVQEIVRSKGTLGLKAYFAAELKSRDNLVIKVDDVLAEQPF
ncbi:hypothetical protein BC834DRAFT_521305 [Gloeopeniophorella convolvens]|nr:hypothetical protein BC834DRAFT_521305 [Gloeopeniophorella convolvens]